MFFTFSKHIRNGFDSLSQCFNLTAHHLYIESGPNFLSALLRAYANIRPGVSCATSSPFFSPLDESNVLLTSADEGASSNFFILRTISSNNSSSGM
mmetsp:Transcript_3744/g.8201  ORF Transcript_3744/g.8201 Transcript_3744/m.8201 type:complete len:96 (+) Transcript_3744:2130-2417(+)